LYRIRNIFRLERENEQVRHICEMALKHEGKLRGRAAMQKAVSPQFGRCVFAGLLGGVPGGLGQDVIQFHDGGPVGVGVY
jgi:hypothetical protein